jgi:hypothetical protein
MKHLIHIGYPRTGSTYLRYYFTNSKFFVHEMRAVSGFKQPVDFVRYSYSPLPEARYFVASEEEFSCWSGPDFNLSSFNRSYDVTRFRENLAKTLKDFYGDAKVLIVTRGHEAMVKSLYAQYINYGGRMGFIEFIDSPNGEILKELLDYKTTTELYESIFGKDNLIVMPYELMQADTHQFMKVLSQKLEVPFEDFSSTKVNSSLSIAYLENSLKLSYIIYKLLRVVGKKREGFFNYYAFFLMNRKFDWAFSLANLLSKKVDLQTEFNSSKFKEYILSFPSQQQFAQQFTHFNPYISYYS